MDTFDEFNALLDEQVIATTKRPNKKLGYVYEPDKITLSASKLTSLRNCPRRFLLREIYRRSSYSTNIDTAYGSAFGAGVQELFRSGNLPRAWLAALAEWDYEYFYDEWGSSGKADKNFFMCLWAIECFYVGEYQRLSSTYELAYINGKPGIELFVYVKVGDSYNYQLHIDLVLRNTLTNSLCIAEIKTSKYAQQEANWGNQEQTQGYYAVLETLAKLHEVNSSPEVLYITHQTGQQLKPDFGNVTFEYVKEKKTTIDFVKNVLITVDEIEVYIKHGMFPKRGNACVTFGRQCEFYGMCDMETLMQVKEDHEDQVYESLTLDDTDFILDLQYLIEPTKEGTTNE